jgi:tetratricopeptide (TPR) repeat protein
MSNNVKQYVDSIKNCLHLGKQFDAIKIAKEILLLGQNDSIAYLYLGIAYSQLNELKKAIKYLQQAIDANGSN